MLTSVAKRALRVAPFLAVSALSLWVAGRAPEGRKPFQFDVSLSGEDLARSMTKVPHLRSIAILFVLATLAVGSDRLLLALGLTMLVGFGWEIAETTVVGHNARLADLAPNLVAGIGSFAIVAAIRWLTLWISGNHRRRAVADDFGARVPPNDEMQRTKPAQAAEPRR